MQTNGTAAHAAVRTQSAPITPAPSRMTLTAIRRGPQANPRRFLVYGVEGVGKSSFAAGAPNAIFLCPEDGTDELDIARFPEPRSWQEILDALNSLLAGDHDFKTLVVDTVDWIEPLLFAHVCKLAGKQSITDFGYGDGYRASLDLWRVFTSRCDELRHKRGMQIVLLGHSQVKEFRDPSNDAYERYQLKLYKDSSGWLREWSDAVLFANYDVATKENKRGRIRAFDSGTRFLYTVRAPLSTRRTASTSRRACPSRGTRSRRRSRRTRRRPPRSCAAISTSSRSSSSPRMRRSSRPPSRASATTP